MHRKGSFKKYHKIEHSIFFTSKKSLLKIIIITFLYHGSMPLSIIPHLLPLPPKNMLDHVSKQYRPYNMFLLETSNFMYTLMLFPWCKLKWSWDESNSQSQILQGLKWLHGPWCEQPLIVLHLTLIGVALPMRGRWLTGVHCGRGRDGVHQRTMTKWG